MIVEDDAAYRYAAGAVLRIAGFTVHEAADYREATRLLRSHKMDLLLIDIVLPTRVNGFAIGRIARMLRDDVRLVYITAYQVPTTPALGKILRKPIEDTELVQEIRAALAA